MTLLRALVSRFSALLGDVYYEGTVPPDAPYPYTVVSAKIPAAFGGAGEIAITLTLAKNRHGVTGKKIPLKFNGALQKFTEPNEARP